MESENLPLERLLRQEILLARGRVYRAGQATPLEKLTLNTPGPEIWVKREDLSPIKAYKWRGAFNKMASLNSEEIKCGVVTASAGNHAQGIALSAKKLGIFAHIFMPRSTPKVKIDAVTRLGGEFIKITLHGDSYDEAFKAASELSQSTGATYVHAYDDLKVIAGQATLADEIVLSGIGPMDAVYLQIGGGGMAAGVSSWLKFYWPDTPMIGVESEGQASMKAALETGDFVTLDKIDLFCDGTAVRRAGNLPFQICQDTIDHVETVSNVEVCQAVSLMWENLRCVCEPSGALGLAAVLKNSASLIGKKVLIVVSGANIDFRQLALISQNTSSISQHHRTLRIQLQEQAGSMLKLLNHIVEGVNISDFQYGKNHPSTAWATFTFSAPEHETLQQLTTILDAHGYLWQELQDAPEIAFRAIALRPDLLKFPSFLRLEFHERPGALYEFLEQYLQGNNSISYFNYRQSGENIGRALIGIDSPSTDERDAFLSKIPATGDGYRLCEVLDANTQERLIPAS